MFVRFFENETGRELWRARTNFLYASRSEGSVFAQMHSKRRATWRVVQLSRSTERDEEHAYVVPVNNCAHRRVLRRLMLHPTVYADAIRRLR